MLAKTGVHHYTGSEYTSQFALEPSRARISRVPGSVESVRDGARRPGARVSGVPSPPGF